MGKFLDRLPEKEKWVTKSFGGFDPDLHESALATVLIEQSNYHRKRILDVQRHIFKIQAKFKRLDAVYEMITTIEAGLPRITCTAFLIEAQQLYPRKDATRQKLVGQGNNLIHLGYITGAIAMALAKMQNTINISLPAGWKGQKNKTTMRKKALQIIKDHQREDSDIAETLEEEQSEHAMDAVCMALTEAGFKI